MRPLQASLNVSTAVAGDNPQILCIIWTRLLCVEYVQAFIDQAPHILAWKVF